MPDPVAVPATEPAAAPVGDSGPAIVSAIPEDFDTLESAFSLSALKPAPAAADPAPEPAADGDSAPPAAVASKPAAEVAEPTETTTSSAPRRGKVSEAERQDWAEREAQLKADWEADRQRAEQAEREAAVLRGAEQERVQAYVARMGEDKEFNRLNGLPSSSLSFEEQTNLDNWKENRKDRDLLEQDATNRMLNFQAAAVQRASKSLAGVDPDAVQKAENFEAIYALFHEAGGNVVRAELQDKIAQLEADNRALRAQRVGQARQPEAGGASPASTQVNPNTWPTHLTAEEDLAAAFGTRPRNGR